MFDRAIMEQWPGGFKALDTQSKGPCSKPLAQSAFYPSEVDQMSTRDFWDFSGKK